MLISGVSANWERLVPLLNEALREGLNLSEVRRLDSQSGESNNFAAFSRELADELARLGLRPPLRFSVGNGQLSQSIGWLCEAIARDALANGAEKPLRELFSSLSSPEALALRIIAIEGIVVDRPIDLGSIVICDTADIPESDLKSRIFVKDRIIEDARWTGGAHTCIVQKHYYAPFVCSHEDNPEIQKNDHRGFLQRHEAGRDLVGLLSVFSKSGTIETIGWDHIDRPFWGLARPIQSYTLGSTRPRANMPIRPCKLIADEVRPHISKFLSFPESLRAQLRGPISRLNSALHEWDPVDKAIDLGIGLESLLHVSEATSEKRYQVSLRAALLAEDDSEKRQVIAKFAGRLYDARSAAVHTGRLPEKISKDVNLDEGCGLLAHLIQRLIAAGGQVEWQTVILKGMAPILDSVSS